MIDMVYTFKFLTGLMCPNHYEGERQAQFEVNTMAAIKDERVDQVLRVHKILSKSLNKYRIQSCF